MKKFLTLLSFIICLTSIILPKIDGLKVCYAENSSSEIVMESSTGRVLYAKNEQAKKYMASTTKILTAITIIENCDVNEEVVVDSSTTNVEGSSIYLEAGERLTVKDLLYGLMLRSGNDCAKTLAVHCSKNVKEFAVLMNKTARKIGAKSSNFVNPHGLHDDNHYTTAYDLALISRYAMQNEIFREIVSTKRVRIPFTTRNTVRLLINKNKMLNEFEGSNGIKTGYTKKAGRCLVSSCIKNGMELICVVLNCPPMFEHSKTLLTECFKTYSMKKLVNASDIIDFLEVLKSQNRCAIYIKEDIVVPLTQEEEKTVEVKYSYPKILKKGLKADSEVGNVKIMCKNNLLFSQKIYNIVDTK